MLRKKQFLLTISRNWISAPPWLYICQMIGINIAVDWSISAGEIMSFLVMISGS